MSRADGTPVNLYDEREVMEEFISCYRHFTALWDSTSDDYLSKQKKEPGYRQLLNILQRINGDATVQDVKRKINSLRCCYRRQIKKVQASENGYKPRLWWYHLMDFLNPILNIQSPLRVKSESLDDSLDEASINNPYGWFEPIVVRQSRSNPSSYDKLCCGLQGCNFSFLATLVVRQSSVVRFKVPFSRSSLVAMSHSDASIELWREFFKLYRSMPELWLVRSKSYRNRRLKDESYGRLLTLMRQIDSNANTHSLKRKINNFRTSYRRELRKVIRSEHSYVPGLWYFKDLDFLCELETGALEYNDNVEEEREPEMEQQSTKVENLEGITENVETREINEISSSSSSASNQADLDHHQVVVHHIHDNEDDDIFAGSFHKEEDVLGGMEPVSEGEAEPEPYLDTEADPADPADLVESQPIIAVRHRSDLKGNNNNFHDSTTSSREGHDLDKSLRSSSSSRRIRRRRRSSNNNGSSDYERGKRQRVKEDLSPDRNRDRDRDWDWDSDSECELIGRRMAAHFRNMRTEQRLFAERIISEVLVFGRMNRLSFDSQFIPNSK